MAFLTETRSTAISVADHANDAIANFKAYLARRRVERQTYRELAALSDRELSDLGMNRTMIASIAREAAKDI